VERALLGLLLVLQLMLLEHAAWRTGPTWDERLYIFYGANQVLRGEVCVNAVPAWGFGLMQVAAGETTAEPDPVSLDPEKARAGWLRLFASRQATVLVTLLTSLTLWWSARRWGVAEGLAAAAMWALSPTVLGHGSLATLDVWAAASAAVATAIGLRWAEAPSRGLAAAFGVVVALGVGAKVIAGGALVVALAAVAWLRPRLLLAHGGVACGAFVLGLWAGYGFDVGPVHSWSREIVLRRVPAPGFFQAMHDQFIHGFMLGHSNVVLGRTVDSGVWWYWPVCIFLKSTVGGLLLGGLAAARSWRSPRREDLLLLAWPLLLLVILSVGQVQLGIRYLLPAFPGAILWAARAVGEVRRAGLGLIALGALEMAARAPAYIAFFSVFAGGPDRGVRLLPVGSDWCQARPELQRWVLEHTPERLFYVPCGPYTFEPEHFEPRCAAQTGVYAVHASELFRTRRTEPGCLNWLREREPDVILGHSIFVFEVKPGDPAVGRGRR
jgi:hypothetical protein